MTVLAEEWFPGDPLLPGAVVDRWWDEGGEAVAEDEDCGAGDFPVSAAALAGGMRALEDEGVMGGELARTLAVAVLKTAGPLLLAERLRVICDQLAAAGPWLAAHKVSPDGSAYVAVAAIRADMLQAAKLLEGVA